MCTLVRANRSNHIDGHRELAGGFAEKLAIGQSFKFLSLGTTANEVLYG